MLGFDDIRAVAHAAEDVLAGVRDAGAFPPGLAALLLRATAALRAQVTGAGEPVDDLIDDLAATVALAGGVRHRAGRGGSGGLACCGRPAAAGTRRWPGKRCPGDGCP